MTVYLIMAVIVCGFSFLAMKQKDGLFVIGNFKISRPTVYLILAAIPLVLVSGLRWETGIDHTNYYYVFYNIRDHLNTHVEIGFKLLCKAILLFTQNLSVMFFLCALITGVFTTIAIRQNSDNYLMSMFLYMAMGYYFYSMNSIRHFMALGMYLFAFIFMRKRKFLPFLLVILAAACFHKIALIAIPLYFLLNIRYKAYWYGIFAGILLPMMFFHRQILDFIYQFVFGFYKQYEAANVGYSYLNIFITLVLSILCFIYRKQLLERDKSNIILINSAYFGLIFFSLCGWIPVYTRIGQYLTVLSLFLIPKIIQCEQNKKIRIVYTVGVYVGFTALMIVLLLNARDPMIALNPYQSVFSK